jgi:hypothetical protein
VRKRSTIRANQNANMRMPQNQPMPEPQYIIPGPIPQSYPRDCARILLKTLHHPDIISSFYKTSLHVVIADMIMI